MRRLSTIEINEIESYLKTGAFTQQQIAEMTGVKRGAIQYHSQLMMRRECPQSLPTQKKPTQKWITTRVINFKRLPGQKCPICSEKSDYIPCVACLAKEELIINQTQNQRTDAETPPLAVGIDLKGNDLIRYWQVRAFRESCKSPHFPTRSERNAFPLFEE